MRNKFQNMPILRKMTLLFVIAILVPSTLFSFVQQQMISEQFLKDETNGAKATLRLISEAIEMKARTVESNLLQLAYNEDLVSLLSYSGKSAATRSIIQIYDVNDVVHYANIFMADLEGYISVYALDQRVPESYYWMLHLDRITESAGYQAFAASGENFAWVGLDWPYPESVVPNPPDNTLGYVCYRAVVTGLGNRIGALKCGVNPDRLFEPIESLAGDAPIYLMQGGSVIYQNANVEAADILGFYVSEGASTPLKTDNGLYITEEISALKITLVMRLDQQAILRDSYNGIPAQLFAILGTGVLMLVVMRLTMASIFKNLVQTQEYIRRVSVGDFSFRFPSAGKDELGQLIAAINVMLSQIETQVQEISRRKESEREAQIMALQYQVNPHFMFNTLNWLQMSVELGENLPQLSEAVAMLGEMLRYNLSGEPFAPIAMEIENLKEYVTLTNLRRQYRITLDIDIPDELMDVQVMRFMCQPVIENAVKHGMSEKDPLTVRLRAVKAQGFMVISFENDGKPIAEDDLVKLQAALAKPVGGEGIGLANIAGRLRLLYGEDAKVAVESKPGSTIVTLRFRLGGDKA